MSKREDIHKEGVDTIPLYFKLSQHNLLTTHFISDLIDFELRVFSPCILTMTRPRGNDIRVKKEN